MDQKQHDIPWKHLIDPAQFPKLGFSTLPISIDESQIHEAYQALNQILELRAGNLYSKEFEQIDEIIAFFVKNIALVSVEFDQPKKPAIFFKYLTEDADYYAAKNMIQHNISSFHYISGLYNYIIQNQQEIKIKSTPIISFLKILDQITSHVHKNLEGFIEQIQKRMKCSISLKIWRHEYRQNQGLLLPMHFDRSAFTVLVHTLNPGAECLQIYPNKGLREEKEIFSKSRPFPLEKSDFPLLIAGQYAKELFNIEPTPHYLNANSDSKSDKKKHARYSVVFFIGRHNNSPII
ncbi:MAG: hypothetical protein COT85_04490 [Chlamydiae bacterium CG10_big_fil_rev_8_21_14_0_10_42_34]|nr:MAG: hypothetical protein COT85_04490 [Chlamydiae bacterium CG10_big_fil_rev_8_21_14_0_10_42_34]